MEILQLVLNQDSSDPPTEIRIRSSNEIRSKGDPPTERRSSNELILVTRLFSNVYGIRLKNDPPTLYDQYYSYSSFIPSSSIILHVRQYFCDKVLAKLDYSSPSQVSPRQDRLGLARSRQVPTNLGKYYSSTSSLLIRLSKMPACPFSAYLSHSQSN